MALPLADIMLERVEILEVNRASPEGGQGGAGSEAGGATRDGGPVTSIVVRVPRSFQTLLAFGASTSQLRYAIVSPMADTVAHAPAPAMSWGKYAELIAWKERQAVARGETLTTTLFPKYRALPEPGLAAILPIAPEPTPVAETTPVPDAMNSTPAPVPTRDNGRP
jgi:hypothetical protein